MSEIKGAISEIIKEKYFLISMFKIMKYEEKKLKKKFWI